MGQIVLDTYHSFDNDICHFLPQILGVATNLFELLHDLCNRLFMRLTVIDTGGLLKIFVVLVQRVIGQMHKHVLEVCL